MKAGFLRSEGRPTLARVAQMSRRIDAWARREELSETRRRDLLLIHDELASNVVRHGTAVSRFSVRLENDPVARRIRYVLEDDGTAFDPTSRDRPEVDAPIENRVAGGLGIHLVRELALRVSWRDRAPGNRLEVVLES